MELTFSKKKYYDIINNIVKFNKISHAYIIEIDNYDVDFSCVLDFVKLIFLSGDCVENTDTLISTGTHPDLIIIEPEGTVIKKGQLLKLQEELRNKSFIGNKRIYIIKEADKLNDASGNTILKFLEEPEDDIIAILVTTNRYKIIETILSRCQILSLQDSNNSLDISDNILDIIKFITKKDDLFINYQYILDNIVSDKVAAKEIFSNVQVILVDYLNYIASDKTGLFNKQLDCILSKMNLDTITNIISIIEEELRKLEYNVNYKLWLDGLFARLIGG